MEVVAGPVPTKYPNVAKCPWCKRTIGYGEMVVKIGTEGSTTIRGQGPGYWVHASHVKASVERPKPRLPRNWGAEASGTMLRGKEQDELYHA